MNTKLLYLSLFLAISLACGMQAPKVNSTPVAIDTQMTPEMSTDVQMVVTGDLWVRPVAGELHRAVGELHTGDVVTCTEFQVIGDSIWCKHERGWSNVNTMKGLEAIR
jgi:hypothetical protein